MMRHLHLDHKFVKHIPEQLEPGMLYVSMEFGSVAHLCCCGCGSEIITPLTPTDWNLTYDGETVSLWPSVGNWNLKCKSHYIIECGRIRECGKWSNRQIESELQRDKIAKARHYQTEPVAPLPTPPSSPQLKKPLSLLETFLQWVFGKKE